MKNIFRLLFWKINCFLFVIISNSQPFHIRSLDTKAVDVISYCYQKSQGNYPYHFIYSINSDGTSDEKLINSLTGFNHQDYSPDGTKLTLTGYVDKNNKTWSIYVYDILTKNMTRLTNSMNVWDADPSWSPDGNTILFTSMMDGNYEIYKMKPDGTELTRLTNNIASEGTPDWSPDGKLIAFVSDRIGTGNFQIFIMNADGSNVNQLTNTPATVTAINPSWRPRQATIINDKIEKNTPKDFIVFQNFPNPFNSSTHINFVVPFEGEVKIVLYNSIGKEIVTFFRQIQPAGKYEINFDATDLASGVYFYSITAESAERKTYTITKKMLLLR